MLSAECGSAQYSLSPEARVCYSELVFCEDHARFSQPMVARKYGRARTILLTVATLATCGAVVWVIWQRWSDSAATQPGERLGEKSGYVANAVAVEARIRAFCGDCHAMPRPESFPRDAWQIEVEKAYRNYVDSGRTDLDPPAMGQAVEFYRSRAPEAVLYPEPTEADTPLRTSFQAERLDLDPDQQATAAIAGLCWTALGSNQSPVLLASDMFSGRVTALDLGNSVGCSVSTVGARREVLTEHPTCLVPGSPQRKTRLLAQLNNPCHLEPSDLDGDGAIDLVVADLGSYDVRDHDLGRVVWLRQDGRTGRFDEVVLASGLGRVADVRPIALDSSGTLGLVVAEFGWFRTGGVLLLTNLASPGQPPRFEPQVVDPRTGAIHVPVCDLDRDGRLDFLALVSNESECVEAFLNQGNGKFHRETLWQAPDLSFGSSGIELVDLDGDGDLDVLYANGDSFDNMYVTPWHGVQWLENRGQAQFEYHRLADMSGACVTRAGDFDGDGDLDILVVAFLPPGLKPDWLGERQLPSIVLLEQTSPGHFVRHTLERGFPCHAAAAIGDFNHDGRLDFAVGNHAGGHRANALGRTWLTLWWNQGNTPRQRP